MGFFKKEKEIVIETICPQCKMEFPTPERTIRHISKAHKPKKRFDCNTCGFRN